MRNNLTLKSDKNWFRREYLLVNDLFYRIAWFLIELYKYDNALTTSCNWNDCVNYQNIYPYMIFPFTKHLTSINELNVRFWINSIEFELLEEWKTILVMIRNVYCIIHFICELLNLLSMMWNRLEKYEQLNIFLQKQK